MFTSLASSVRLSTDALFQTWKFSWAARQLEGGHLPNSRSSKADGMRFPSTLARADSFAFCFR